MWATELTAVDLHVSLRRHPALRGIDLSCSGGTTALVGPNGSGKSTLLRTIMGLTAATSGLIHVAGRYTMREALDYATWTSPSRPPSARSSQSRPRSPQSC
ncbi:ATP-binding cassette domain-containing protein [Actinomyces israelii]|mgnify:CR=1 FL=1